MSDTSLWQMVSLSVNKRRTEVVMLRLDDTRHPFDGDGRDVFAVDSIGIPKPAGFEVQGAALSPWCAPKGPQ